MHPDKRYLLINYVAEYDKISYPLPLTLQEVPNFERMKLVVKRLRSEVDIYRRGNVSAIDLVKENASLKQENDLFKSRIKKLEESLHKSSHLDKPKE